MEEQDKSFIMLGNITIISQRDKPVNMTAMGPKKGPNRFVSLLYVQAVWGNFTTAI